MEGFETEELTFNDRGQLFAVAAMPGFRILQFKIMEAAVRKFNLKLINTEASDEKRVLAAHKMAKLAAQFYEEVIAKMNSEIELYRHAPRVGDPPERAAENIIESSLE